MNLSLQFVSSDDNASRTLSGLSNFVSAARHNSSFASRIATSGDDDFIVVVDERRSAEDDDDDDNDGVRFRRRQDTAVADDGVISVEREIREEKAATEEELSKAKQ